MSEKNKLILLAAFIIVVVALAIFSNNALWNNGTCRKCGGNLVFRETEYETLSSSNGKQGGSVAHHIYECEDCGYHVDLRIDPRGLYSFVYR